MQRSSSLHHEIIETDLFDTYYYLDEPIQSCNYSESDQFHNILIEVDNVPKQSCLTSFYSRVNPKDYVNTFFPLVMAMERLNGRLNFQCLLYAFERWKLCVGLKTDIFTILPIPNQHDDLVYWNPNIEAGIESILMVIRNLMDRNSASILHDKSVAFSKWKSFASVIRKLQRNVPCGFRVLALLGHSVLWNIFLQYCSDKRKIPQENRCTISVTKYREKSANDGDFPLYHTNHKYNKKLLTSDRLVMFMKDCRIIPIVMGKRRLESLLSSQNCGKAMDFNISSPYTSNNLLSSPMRKQEMVSFNTFLKIYWKIFGEIVGVEKLSRSQIANIRGLLFSTDENCVKQAKLLNYSGDWNKFLSSIVR